MIFKAYIPSHRARRDAVHRSSSFSSIIDSLVLIVAVLLQSGQGGGMAASFGGVSSSASSFMGTRQTGNLLTKASWWCGGLFLGLSFLLALASTRSRAPKSVLDQTFQTPR